MCIWCVHVAGKQCGVGSLLLLFGFWEMNSSCQAWPKILCAEPSHQSKTLILLFHYFKSVFRRYLKMAIILLIKQASWSTYLEIKCTLFLKYHYHLYEWKQGATNTVLRWNFSEEIVLKVKWLLWGRCAVVRAAGLEWRSSFSTISIYSHHAVGTEAFTHFQLPHRERGVIVSWERLRTGDLLSGKICEFVTYLTWCAHAGVHKACEGAHRGWRVT